MIQSIYLMMSISHGRKSVSFHFHLHIRNALGSHKHGSNNAWFVWHFLKERYINIFKDQIRGKAMRHLRKQIITPNKDVHVWLKSSYLLNLSLTIVHLFIWLFIGSCLLTCPTLYTLSNNPLISLFVLISTYFQITHSLVLVFDLSIYFQPSLPIHSHHYF